MGLSVKAIILSAGQGKRLLPLTESQPKCLLPLAGRTLLEWQLRALAANGVTEATIVVGFAAEAVDYALADMEIPGIRAKTLYNPFYAVADNVGSCFVVRHEMTGDFVLLNGDTLFEPAVLAKLLASATGPVTVTIDRKDRYDADDMKVRLDGERLVEIGKALPLDTVDGESIGMLLFREDGGARFLRMLDTVLREPDGVRRWYLSAIDRLSRTDRVGVVSIEGSEWGEVDFLADVDRAGQLAEGWVASGRFDGKR